MALSIFQRTVTNESGDIIPNSQVEVRLESTGSLATLYTDKAGTIGLSNPFSTGTDGLIKFYAAADEYQITATDLSTGDIITWDDVYLGNKYIIDAFNSVKELVESGAGNFDGQQISVSNYHDDLEGGGGTFRWDSTRNKADHNGGTVIDPDHSSSPGVNAFYVSENVGSGCWVRVIEGGEVYVNDFGVHGDGSTNWRSIIPNALQRLLDISVDPNYTVTWTPGEYATIIEINRSNVKMKFEAGAEFHFLFHIVKSDPAIVGDDPITNIKIWGDVVTYDRVGITNVNDLDIYGNIICKSDQTESKSGNKGRGLHGYFGTKDIRVHGDIIVENTSNQTDEPNNHAAVAIDGQGDLPQRWSANKIIVKDSRVHGVYIQGNDHDFGSIEVHGYVDGVLSSTLQGALASESIEGKAVWFNRASGKVGRIYCEQKQTGDTSRGYEESAITFDQSMLLWTDPGVTFSTTTRGICVDLITVKNPRKKCVEFGPYGESSYAEVKKIDIEIDTAVNLVSTNSADRTAYGLVWIGGGYASIGDIIVEDSGRALAVRQSASTIDSGVTIGSITVKDHKEGIAQFRELHKVGIISSDNRSSGGTETIPGVEQLVATGGRIHGSTIDVISLKNPSNIPGVAYNNNGCRYTKVGSLIVSDYNQVNGTVRVSGGSFQRIMGMSLTDATGTGVGLLLESTVNAHIGDARIDGFDLGIANNATTQTRLLLENVVSTGSTTASSNIPAAQVTEVNCVGTSV